MLNQYLWCGAVRFTSESVWIRETHTNIWCDERHVSVARHRSKQIQPTTHCPSPPLKSAWNDKYSPYSWRDASIMRWRLCVASHLVLVCVWKRAQHLRGQMHSHKLWTPPSKTIWIECTGCLVIGGSGEGWRVCFIPLHYSILYPSILFKFDSKQDR